jgi:DNA-directed RNA polymerase beta subunit
MQTIEPNDSELTNNKIFELMDARFTKKYVLYEHLHNSYNDLINQIINYLQTNDNMFNENRVGDLIYRYRFKFENLFVRPPLNDNGDSLMYPMDARDRNATYSIKLIAKITQLQEVYDLNKKEILETKVIGTPVERETVVILPCMVRSQYCSLEVNRDYTKRDCEYDPGGYFIVNGSEKIVLSIERMVENKPLVFVKKDAGVSTYMVKVNSKSANTNIMTQGIEIRLEKNYDIIIKVPILNEVSVFVLMRALGLETDKEIIKYIMYNDNDIDMLNLLKISIDLSKKEGKKLILTKEDAYYSLTNKLRVVKKYADKDKKLQYDEKKEHLEVLLRNAFLPHINSDHHNDVFKTKALFLGLMINRLLNCYLGRTEPDDRDSFVNKRIDLPGDLIFDLFKQHYKKMLNDCNKFFSKRSGSNHVNPLNIINQIKPSNIEQGIKSAMMTGNWGKKKGVAQMYPRLTFLQSLSFLRRVDAPSADASTSKLTGPRHYHPSQVGFLCLTGDCEILMSDGSVKLIKNVQNGDYVKTYDYQSGNFLDTEVKNWFSQSCDKLINITFNNGVSIKCTPDHEFLVKYNNGFQDVYEMKKISDVSMSMDLIQYTGSTINFIKVVNIEDINTELVYDFETVENTHNFIANSIVVKNCCVESPEHSNIGLVKHLSLLGSITVGTQAQAILIYKMLCENANFIHLNNHSAINLAVMTKVFLNGEWVGMSDKPNELFKELRLLKQNGIILRTNGMTHDIVRGEIRIYTESGRLYRPIINVKNNQVVLSDKMINDIVNDPNLKGLNKFDALITKYPEAIDYMDMEEQFFALVAEYKDKVAEMKKRETNVFPDKNEPIINRYDNSMVLNYTHCEFHPSMIIGIIAGNIPFANHNQGPRNIFQYANQNWGELLIQ